MTAPIAMVVPAPAEAAQPQTVPQADGDDGAFGATLGAALAAQAGQLAVIVPEPVPTAPLLDLLVQGEWSPDDAPAPSDAEAQAGDPTSDQVRDPGRDVPIVPLEKSLASWFATVGARGEGPRPTEAQSDDPAEVDLDAAASPTAEAPETAGILLTTPEAAGSAAVIALVAPVSHQVAPATTDATNTEEQGSPAPGTGDLFNRLRETRFQPSDPAQRPTDSAAGAPGDREPSPARQPVIEIAGFTFPDPAAGGQDQGANPGQEKPAPEWAGRIRELKSTGNDGDMAREAVRRATAAAARPTDETPKAPATVRPTMQGDREPVRPRREVTTTVDTPSPRAEHRAGDGVPRSIPEAAGSNRPLVDASVGPQVERVAPTSLDPGERIARRVDSLMLDLKDDQGDYGKLKVSVSGASVRATIMPNDQSMADRLNVEIRQLHQSLTERGFPEPKVTVQNPPAATDLPRWNPLAREGVADTAATDHRSPGRNGPDDERRERWTGTREQQQERREQGRTPDQPRNRKRDQNGRDA